MAACQFEAAFAQLQSEISDCEKALLKLIKVKKYMPENTNNLSKINAKLRQTNVAIIGMASIFPQSKNLQEYWDKIIQKVDCITDVPPSRWSIDDYYDPNPKTPDKTYCKRGGFIPDIDFNPLEFGLPPNILEVTDISQLLGLVVAKAAMEDAGYGESQQLNRDIYDRTGVVLGVAIGRQLAIPLSTRLQYPVWEKVLKNSGLSAEDTQKIIAKIQSAYVQWEENAFPGMLANVISGRIANRLDLGGLNCVVDAACASSLGALKMAISELVEHRADMMITGGVDTDNSILAYMCFSKTPAVSPGENVKPFDVNSDGMMLGEGVGMLVLKRLEDAQRDGDRIYAVIKGIGTSSDGRYKSIYAPRSEGQVKALHRAYEDAGFSPSSVGLMEAHGTGTMVGDPTEFSSIKQVFGENNPKKQYIALGTVKSQIGHTKAAAGAASLIKTALALHHKVLPPTINITQPHPKLNIETSPFYLNTETRPWITNQPRRAGVSAFGFGGTNYHVVLEEYEPEHNHSYRLHNTAKSILLFAPTTPELLSRCLDMQQKLQSEDKERHYAELITECESVKIPVNHARVGFVADSLTQAGEFLQIIIDSLKNKPEAESWEHPKRIYYRQRGIETSGKVVALFSGQGSQYLEMGREVAVNFPYLRQIYAHMDNLLCEDGLRPLSEVVFPPPVFDTTQKASQLAALQMTEYAQPAIGAFSAGLYKILQQAGFKPDFVAGHSFGELTALWAGGVLSEEDYLFLVKARGQAMAAPADSQFDAGGMLAVQGDVIQVTELIQNFPQIAIANCNSQRQVVLAGKKTEIAQVQDFLNQKGFSTVLLGVSAAFHTPLVAHAQKPFAKAIEKVTFNAPQIPVYTNVTGGCYSNEAPAIQKILKEHLLNQVLFQQEIENLYESGGYCFVEFGPKNILTKLVKDILSGKPHLAVALNGNPSKNSSDDDRTLREAVIQLRVAGLPLQNLDPYQITTKIPEVDQKKVLNVRLNSTNLNDKTQQAFTKALQNGHIVNAQPATPQQLEPVNGNGKSVNNGQQLEPVNGNGKSVNNGQHLEPINGNGKSVNNGHHLEPINGNGKSVNNGQHLEPANGNGKSVNNGQHLEPANGNGKSVNNHKLDRVEIQPQNYERVIDSLEYSLKEFNRQQRDIMHVHEQSLTNQTEYTKNFVQLMQQQHTLWENNQVTPEQIKTQQTAIASSERSIMQFHEHQADTLHIHQQYLNYQQEYTHNYFQLIQQHYQVLLADDTSQPQPECRDITYNITTISPPSEQEELYHTRLNADHQDSREQGETEFSNFSANTEIITNQPDLILESKSHNGNHVEAEEIATITVVPTTPHSIDVSNLSPTLLNIVSDKTGYPAEMLDLSMDIEADLGIDSIKRVEILGGLLELYPDLPKPNPEELGQLRTLSQIVEYIQTQVRDLPNYQIEVSEATISPAQMLVEIPHEGIENDRQIPEPPPQVTVNQPATTIPADLSNVLLNIVSDKTGYPAEMLELSMDIEADLGIDSIKRVEILGSLLELYPDLPKPNPEELGQLRTLGQIVEYVQNQGTRVSSAVENPSLGVTRGQGDTETRRVFDQQLAELDKTELVTEATQNVKAAELNHRILRSPAKLKQLPQPDILDFTIPENHIALITDDGSSTTEKLAAALTAEGWKTVVLSFPSLGSKLSENAENIDQVMLVDWSDESLQRQLEDISHQYGTVAAFIHLHPLHNIHYLETEKTILRHVFLIAKHLKEPLNQAANKGRSSFLTVARLDGKFGLGRTNNFSVIAGGLFGLTKSLNQEWETVFCRCCDLSPDLDAETSVKHILSELKDPNLLVTEVGYSKTGRFTLVADTPSQLPITNDQLPITNNQVFLVSGGAKGITAQCVIKLAQESQCKFILLGRSSTESEPVWAEGCENEAELKQRIMEDFQAKGEKPTPIMVQKKYQTISSQREIQNTLKAIEKAGGKAEYLSVDVTEGVLLQEKLAPVIERLGAITGIIHGAGNLADKRIEKKSIQDFETVYAAKVKGLENLLHCLPPSQLQYLILFSSVVGFYGNVGQSDYAIANEILNKSAHLIKLNHPDCHVVAINWGPWDSGMVSPELKKAFAERRIETIPIEVGAQVLVNELKNHNQETVQVVIGSPLVSVPTTLNSELKNYRIHRQLTLAANPFLHDHVIAGRPVLPATCGLLWMANTCEQLYPGYKALCFPNFKVLKGIVFDENLANEYNLELQEIAKIENQEIEFTAKISSKSADGKIRYHFSSNIILKRETSTPPNYEFLNLQQDEKFLSTNQLLYQHGASSLFHGTTFQGVKSVLNASPAQLTLECYLPQPTAQQQGQFSVQTFNPYIADVQIHSLWIWTQQFHQLGCLPAEIQYFEQFASVPFGETFYVTCEIKSQTALTVIADVITHNRQGQVYNRMIGAKGTILSQPI
ncbi:type I polyketide synthase [Anabaena lutea]|uniref:SDR family NAD(P)-dependent oxidoreductase n=1 Tax=Anabaena lutea FACHB-196 TaxID=2692881 RepID=A0ABR8FHR8_9NOST|nr:type I polyketide synthase [Anabaena lutea]MBD2569653.1 SDR family NAD(P)-dependent oxidoreductase [Anabaena lutea FACHB-196]